MNATSATYPLPEHDLDVALTLYMDAIGDNFEEWTSGTGYALTGTDRSDRVREFRSGLTTARGRNYIKVLREGSAHSFIVIKPTKGFKVGDILKAATWAAPATNFARGNVFTGDGVRGVFWTGAQ
jgi:hypothetical protein